ncbi:MAG: hypothetical protein N2652_05105 [Kiritimatiellae bacterium]|nr:hypothetical protein [Kiritimatiellia bacterium]
MNRPVHIGRRDALVERAVALLSAPTDSLDLGARIVHVERIIALLERALRESALANRAGDAPAMERDFVHFLQLILENVRSAAAFLKSTAQFESREQTFLREYLKVAREEVELAAVNYRRLSADVLAGLWQMLRLLHIPYRALQQSARETFDDAAIERHRLAYESLRAELAGPADVDPAAAI